MKKLFTKKRQEIISQLFINLSTGWFGLVLIVPGITKLRSIDDFLWLTRNIFFGMLALLIAIVIAEKGKK